MHDLKKLIRISSYHRDNAHSRRLPAYPCLPNSGRQNLRLYKNFNFFIFIITQKQSGVYIQDRQDIQHNEKRRYIYLPNYLIFQILYSLTILYIQGIFFVTASPVNAYRCQKIRVGRVESMSCTEGITVVRQLSQLPLFFALFSWVFSLFCLPAV